MGRKNPPVSQLLDPLPAEQRIARYKQFASEALLKANDAQGPERRTEYQTMAAGWYTLAVETEHAIKRVAQSQADPSDERKAKSA
jgi:hypothetical protein